jgi:hypothetical protein
MSKDIAALFPSITATDSYCRRRDRQPFSYGRVRPRQRLTGIAPIAPGASIAGNFRKDCRRLFNVGNTRRRMCGGAAFSRKNYCRS